MLEAIVKTISKQYKIDVKHPTFIHTNKTEVQKLIEGNENTDPPAVAYTDQFLQRTRSEKYGNNKENYLKKYQLKNCQEIEVTKLLDSEAKINKIEKQDSKENRRDWFKKQLSVNHHYLKDLKMPINSISHRNALLNIKRYRLKASSCPDLFKNSMISVNEKEEVRLIIDS